MSAGWNRPSARRCVCGHDKTLHAWPERRSQGLGACSGQGCACARFLTPGQRRLSEYNRRHAEAVREARAAAQAREQSEADSRTALQEGRDG
jgi:hypothetical protein